MITMKHNLAYIEAKALRTELNLMTRSHFIEIYRNFIEILTLLTKYLFDLSVRLTEFSVTVESVTLRFYCTNIVDVWKAIYDILSDIGTITETYPPVPTQSQPCTRTHARTHARMHAHTHAHTHTHTHTQLT